MPLSTITPHPGSADSRTTPTAGATRFARASSVLLALVLGLTLQGAITAQSIDSDLDGVEDARDNCPGIPNAPDASGEQKQVCGAALGSAINDYVFLQSRTFEPSPGLHLVPRSGAVVRGLLHLAPSEHGFVLEDDQVATLEAAGVTLWDYLPHGTFYATLPGELAALQQVAGLPFVLGLSELTAEDRVARSLRATGRGRVTLADGRQLFSVELFPDVDVDAFAAQAEARGAEVTFVEDRELFVATDDFGVVQTLARQDGVFWIDDAPGDEVDYDQAAIEATATEPLERVHGFTGNGLTVAMAENKKMDPTDHPDLIGRVLHSNWGSSGTEHAMPVGGILIGDGSGDHDKRGFLPEALLVSYTVSGLPPKTYKTKGHWIPKDARNQHDAILVNNSFGYYNCNKIGEYAAMGKWWDKSVLDHGIAIVRAVGNSRGPNGAFVTKENPPCERNLESLPHAIPKNDIAVGNWDMATQDVAETSAAGPSIDGRLKPDLVAPGNGVWTTTRFDDGTYGYAPFGDTSAAAPVVSGIYGQVVEAFAEEADVLRDPLDVPPSTVKALLIHTARDVGPPGPDYWNGWGLVQAAPAVRLAKRWDEFVIEDEVTSAGQVQEHAFDLTSDRFAFKVTMVYTDDFGTHTSTQALINDLDLEVVEDATGDTYYPLDTALVATDPADREAEALLGARGCTSSACADNRNTVEQVIVTSGTPLPQGTWTVRVKATRLLSSSQTYSVVVSPECPVVITGDVTLTGPLACDYDPLEPFAVSIDRDGATLDCDGYAVLGEGHSTAGPGGEYIGIRSYRDGVRIQDCQVQDFAVGIDVRDAVAATVAQTTVDRVAAAGIRLSGERHSVVGSQVRDVHDSYGAGIDLVGTAHSVTASDVDTAFTTGLRTVGLALNTPLNTSSTDGTEITGNDIFGPSIGISVIGVPDDLLISGNGIYTANGDGIRVTGDVDGFEISDNRIEGFGFSHAAIRFEWGDSEDGQIFRNIISGNGFATQSGIVLDGVRDTEVWGHTLNSTLGLGITEKDGMGNGIFGNSVSTTEVAILSEASQTEVSVNSITQSPLGIHVIDPALGTGSVSSNSIAGAMTGILVERPGVEGEGQTGFLVEGNVVTVPGFGVGIAVEDGEGLVASSNTVAPQGAQPGTAGILATDSDLTVITSNTVSGMSSCVSSVNPISAAISDNDLSACVTGVSISGDSGSTVTGNDVLDARGAGIRYSSGNGGRLTANEIGGSPGVPPGRHGILLGSQSLPALGAVSDVLLEANDVSGVDDAVTFGHGTSSALVLGNTLGGLTRALNGAVTGLAAASLTIESNVLRGGSADAVFLTPVDTLHNDWTEVPSLDIWDTDGDGFGDCGADHVFSSSNYVGTLAGVALTSLLTGGVSDEAPVAEAGVCP